MTQSRAKGSKSAKNNLFYEILIFKHFLGPFFQFFKLTHAKPLWLGMFLFYFWDVCYVTSEASCFADHFALFLPAAKRQGHVEL